MLLKTNMIKVDVFIKVTCCKIKIDCAVELLNALDSKSGSFESGGSITTSGT